MNFQPSPILNESRCVLGVPLRCTLTVSPLFGCIPIEPRSSLSTKSSTSSISRQRSEFYAHGATCKHRTNPLTCRGLKSKYANPVTRASSHRGSHARLCSPLFNTMFGGPTFSSGSARGALSRQCPWTGFSVAWQNDGAFWAFQAFLLPLDLHSKAPY